MNKVIKKQEWFKRHKKQLTHDISNGTSNGVHLLVLFDKEPVNERSLKRGAVLSVQGSDKPFGQKEVWPTFLKLRVIDAKVSELEHLSASEKYRIDVAGLSMLLDSEQDAGCCCSPNRVHDVTKRQLFGFIREIR